MHHSYQAPFFKSTWRGEQGAYAAQSEFLRANGVVGTLAQVIAMYPNTDPSYLQDLSDSFAIYAIANPAITP